MGAAKEMAPSGGDSWRVPAWGRREGRDPTLSMGPSSSRGEPSENLNRPAPCHLRQPGVLSVTQGPVNCSPESHWPTGGFPVALCSGPDR